MENLKYERALLYNSGSLVPNNTVSEIIKDECPYFILGVNQYLKNNGRLSFLLRRNFYHNNDEIVYGEMVLRYNKTTNTLKVINNGGILYFLTQLMF